jgi:hypothetical protein
MVKFPKRNTPYYFETLELAAQSDGLGCPGSVETNELDQPAEVAPWWNSYSTGVITLSDE